MGPIKFVIKAYNHIVNYPREYPFDWNKLPSREEGDKIIESLLRDDKPCFIARYGVVELNCVEEKYYQERLIYRRDYTDDLKKRCLINAGIFPNTKEYLNSFAKLYRKATKNVTLFAVWVNQPFEHYAINKYSKCRDFVYLKSLYTGVNNWTKALKSKRVLIVSGFAETMSKQYKIRGKIFQDDSDLLPEMKPIFYKSVVSHGGEEVEFDYWHEALFKMYDDISKMDFDIALLGCGAYGLPLGDLIYSKMHKKVVHVGGSLELLFGIKGKTYIDQEKENLTKHFNEYWVYPSKEETPKLASQIDEGCYWK